jgi:hypothetical protein
MEKILWEAPLAENVGSFGFVLFFLDSRNITKVILKFLFFLCYV